MRSPAPHRLDERGRVVAWKEPEFLLLAVLVGVVYFSRLAALPAIGEETRWARVAILMSESGDWVVPRQQGNVFPERPPFGSWAMAAVGFFTGKIDNIAIRLPSAIASLVTALFLYVYARCFISRIGALATSIGFASMLQVLQLGRSGESEPLFTCFVAGSLLAWHIGYERGRSPALVWSIGYALAALGSLVKGPQAPVYFGAVTWAFLLLRRDFRFLFSWGQLAGIGVYAVIVGSWLLPFYLRTSVEDVVAIWFGLSADRFRLDGLIGHLVGYPFEVLARMLPWSLVLAAFAIRRCREFDERVRPLVQFALIALAVTFPSVWIASEARVRYYMPMFPIVALLIGVVVDRLTAEQAEESARRAWSGFLVLGTIVSVGIGVVLLAAGTMPIEQLEVLRQPWSLIISTLAVAGISVVVLRRARVARTHASTVAAVLTIGAVFGMVTTGLWTNVRVAGTNDPGEEIRALHQTLPNPDELVSMGPVYHRFAFYYETPIRELPWPESAADVPEDVKYFCYDVRPDDTPDERLNGRGRSWEKTSGTLPFDWDEIAVIACHRSERRKAEELKVVIGRIKGR